MIPLLRRRGTQGTLGIPGDGAAAGPKHLRQSHFRTQEEDIMLRSPRLAVGMGILIAAIHGGPSWAQGLSPERTDHSALEERWRSERALLIESQAPTGAFPRDAAHDESLVVATARALWALALEPREEPTIPSDSDVQVMLRGCGSLFRHRQDDGGIYTEPTTAVYESTWAHAALVAVQRRVRSEGIARELPRLESFIREARRSEVKATEGWAEAMERSLREDGELSEADRRALEFIERCRDHESGEEPQLDDDWFEQLPLYLASDWPESHPALERWLQAPSQPVPLVDASREASCPEFQWAAAAKANRWKERHAPAVSAARSDRRPPAIWRQALTRRLLAAPPTDSSAARAYRVATAAQLLTE